MAKQTRSQKQIQVQNPNGKGYQQEHTEVFDDNLLPDAQEIQALHQIDPQILDWLKTRAEKEQDFRHIAHTKRTHIIEKEINSEYKLNILGIIFAFVIIISGMAFSTFLIHEKQIITGTIFSGLTIFVCCYIIL
jgi:uncharacterized membrane protein